MFSIAAGMSWVLNAASYKPALSSAISSFGIAHFIYFRSLTIGQIESLHIINIDEIEAMASSLYRCRANGASSSYSKPIFISYRLTYKHTNHPLAVGFIAARGRFHQDLYIQSRNCCLLGAFLMAHDLNFSISEHVLEKLSTKHKVTIQEIRQCFLNRNGLYLVDLRPNNATNPKTEWFLAITNKGRLLKVCFIQVGQMIEIKTSYEPNATEVEIYNRFAY
jgi:uncharacterized DUF497 family protein